MTAELGGCSTQAVPLVGQVAQSDPSNSFILTACVGEILWNLAGKCLESIEGDVQLTVLCSQFVGSKGRLKWPPCMCPAWGLLFAFEPLV
jgi:hypothetical protein